MTIQEFEKKLQEIDPLFTIVQHPRNPELAGVYYDRNEAAKTGFLVTVPSGEIREVYDRNYMDTTGHPHNWAERVITLCKQHLDRLKNDPDYKKTFYTDLSRL